MTVNDYIPRPGDLPGRANEPPRAAITIREVARAASVSVATVSRVFNGKGPVRRATEGRIREIARKLRYVPHGAARSLITRRTNTVGVLLPDLYGEFFSELIRGIDLGARARDYHLLVSSFHGHREETEAMLRAMRGRVDGLIALSPEIRPQTLRANLPQNFPLVLLNGVGSSKTFDSIGVDNYGGAYAMGRHLSGLGHRRIAFVRGPKGNRDAAERLRGYRDAVREISRKSTADLEIAGDFREESGYHAAKWLLRMRPRPSAVFAANDAMAIGLLCGLRERGIRVPEDVALVGFDDIPIARFLTPPLTSVRVPIAELGSRALHRLLEWLDGEAKREKSETLRTELVVRRSCGVELRGIDQEACVWKGGKV